MKKRFTACMLTLLTSLCIVSCGAKHEEEAVLVENDTERLIAEIKKSDDDTAPEASEITEERYVWSASGANGRLSVAVDAVTDVPKENIPVVRVTGEGLGQDTVKKLFDHLFPGEKPFNEPDKEYVRTKEEILYTIDFYERNIAEGTLEENTVMSEEEALEYIEELKEEYKTAPETLPEEEKTVSDGTMLPKTAQIHDSEGNLIAEGEYMSLRAGTEDAFIGATSGVSGNAFIDAGFTYAADTGMGNWLTLAEADDEKNETAVRAREYLTVTEQEAAALCEAFFEAGGITDVQLAGVYIVSDEYDENIAEDDKHYAYQLMYVRTVSGIPTALLGENVLTERENGNPGWKYEKISFIVGNEGLAYISWDCPTTPGEIIAEAPELLPFSDIKEIFETMVIEEYTSQANYHLSRSDIDGADIRVTVDEIQLRPLRICTGEREGIYTPAWLFLGHAEVDETFAGEEYTVRDSMLYPYPVKYPVMAINAVDGSIIDMEKGY